jgi:hypothetical protein
MANPTTNYGFVLPTSSDLVTDLPADFDVALQGVDTRLKALQPGTTLGDLAYSSATANTNTRLGVGSTGQVLTVSGGVPAWATPGGATLNTSLITNGTITSGTSLSLTGLSSYDQLFLSFTGLNYATGGSQLSMTINSSSAAVYTMPAIENRLGTEFTGASTQSVNNTQFYYGINYGWESANTANGILFAFTNCKSASGFTNVAVNGTWMHTTTSDRIIYTGQGIFGSNATVSSLQLFWADGQAFTGGTYRLYGAA